MIEEQLRLFDPTDYLAMDGMWNIEVEMTEEEAAMVYEAASSSGMTVDDYIIHAMKNYLTCPTCNEYRSTGDVCPSCGEIDQ